MNVQKVHGWRCPSCGLFLKAAAAPVPQVAYRLQESPVSVVEYDGDHLDTAFYAFVQPQRTMVRVCPGCQAPADVDHGGNLRVYYLCGECGDAYTDRVEAKVCCTGHED